MQALYISLISPHSIYPSQDFVEDLKSLLFLLPCFLERRHRLLLSALITRVMDCVTPFIQPFLSCVWDPMVRQIGYLWNAKENVDDMKRAMDDLKAVRNDVLTKIEAARRQQNQSTHVVERWLEKVERVENEVARLVTDYDQRGCRLYEEFSLNCWLNYKISRRAMNIHKDIVDLCSKKNTLEVTTLAPPVPVQEIPSSSNTEAMGSYLEMVRSYLSDDMVSIVGIWGMGGVGKTTLLKAINNNIHQLSNNGGEEIYFAHVIWAVASQELQIVKLQKDIAKHLKLSLPEDASMMDAAGVIFNFLKDKNFLLLIDDLWKRIDLEHIGIPYGSNIGRHKWKVVFKTRTESVCGEMEARRMIKVECLEKEKAWALFQEKVGEEIIQSNPEMEPLAWKVAKECCGLPLALIIIGRAMSTKKCLEDWEHALMSLKEPHIKTFADMHEKLYHQLKFSYDNLLDNMRRECFLCCSLWPEDYEIKKEELIECWMGLGLIEEHDDICKTYNHRHFLITALQEACLLETSNLEGCVRMHDVVRDLALWIASECGGNKNRWIVRAGVGAREAPCEPEKWREVERVSLMCNSIAALSMEPFDCPNLTVSMLQRNYNLTHISSGFFKCLSSSLTYLDLSCTGIEELPKEVGCLVELKYLNLSHTKIKSLPEELGGLSKLKYFLLNGVRTDVPSRVIPGMSSLQVLNAYPDSSVDTDWLDRTPRSLRAIGMRVDSIETLEKLQRLPTRDLQIENLERLVGSLQLQLLGRNMAHCLRKLQIRDCGDLEELEGSALPRLEKLCLERLRHLRETIWKGVAPAQCLQSLNSLYISECPKLKDVTWILQLPSLAYLTLEKCSGMEQVIGGEAVKLLKEEQAINLAFKKLRKVELNDLPKLVSICVVPLPFPSLEHVGVAECPELRRLPFLPEMTNDNKSLKIWGSRAWWEALNWEDDSIKSSFQPYIYEL